MISIMAVTNPRRRQLEATPIRQWKERPRRRLAFQAPNRLLDGDLPALEGRVSWGIAHRSSSAIAGVSLQNNAWWNLSHNAALGIPVEFA
jgi:hypothetical protein